MKNNTILIKTILIWIIGLSMNIGCVRDNEIIIPQTDVNKLPNQRTAAGDTLLITGKNIHLITKILFGKIEGPNLNTDLGTRDKNKLEIIVPVFENTEVVQLSAIYNTAKSTVICDELEIYVAPVVPKITTSLPESTMAGEIISLNGSNLHIIHTIMVNGASVAIRSKDSETITFIAPEVTQEVLAEVKFFYNNSEGSDWELNAGKMQIKPIPPIVPEITSSFPMEVIADEEVILTGINLQVITGIKLNGSNLSPISINETQITFLAPTVIEKTTFDLIIIYSNRLEQNKEISFTSSLVVSPALQKNIYYWKNVSLGGQTTERSLFNATTGEVISPCELFGMQEEVDFLMNISSSNEIQFYSPANATNVLKNQKCNEMALGVMDETGDNKSYSTFLETVNKFRLLAASNSAQAAMIEKALTGTIDDLSNEAFTGISAPASSAPKNPVVNDVFYFKNERKGKNGLMVIRNINIDQELATNSTILIDIYFEK